MPACVSPCFGRIPRREAVDEGDESVAWRAAQEALRSLLTHFVQAKNSHDECWNFSKDS